MTDTISSLFEAIQSYFLDREQELLANITFEVEALQETTSCTLRLTLFFTLLSIVFFNPYHPILDLAPVSPKQIHRPFL